MCLRLRPFYEIKVIRKHLKSQHISHFYRY
ncbi:hypothetical protein V6Z12_D06G075200 [Gossypium hirsutum]